MGPSIPGFYRLYYCDQCGPDGGAWYVHITSNGTVWGLSEFEGVRSYRTFGGAWDLFRGRPANAKMTWFPDYDRSGGPT